MKKLFLIALGAALIATPALTKAQGGYEGVGLYVTKINVEKLRGNIAKSDAEIADAKKNTKSATWIKRGNMFIDVDGKAVNGLFQGAQEEELKLAVPEATTGEEIVDGTPYTVYNSGQAKIYVNGGQIIFYTPAIVVDSAALNKAYEAFDKAYTMDPKTAAKVKTGMGKIHDKAKLDGEIFFSLNDMRVAAKNFRLAYKASAHPTLNAPDTVSLFNAGYADILLGDYATALEDMTTTLAMGYESDGNTRYFKAMAEYQTGKVEESLATMQKGMELFPANENLINFAMAYYTDQGKDPSELVPSVLSAIEKNPKNPKLYDGLARVYDKLGRHDEAIETIKKAIELSPSDWIPCYLEGIYIINKANAMSKEAANNSMSLSASQNKAAKAAIDEVYKTAVAALERAHNIAPKRTEVVAKLKELTYVLREDPEMGAKYEKYDALFKQM